MTPHETLQLFNKTFANLEKWMDKAEAYAKERNFDVDVLTRARLAPDQYDFARQVQLACDQARNTAAYLSGKPGPSHPDTENSFAELHERIRKCAAYVSSVNEADLAGAAERKVSPPWMGGRWLRGHDYLVQMAVPNFFFHVTTAYAILRHNGVPLGKADFIGGLPVQEG
jgi:uncharacterized protein